MWFTITFDVGSKRGVPVEIETTSEAEAIAVFKEYLLNLDETGRVPADWDGWLDDLRISIDGEPLHPIVFQPRWVSNFEVYEGRSNQYGHKVGK